MELVQATLCPGWGMDGWGHMGGWGIMMGLFWITVIVLVVLLVKYLVRNNRSSTTPPEDQALNLLRRRYANGEISQEEFEKIRKDLQKD